MKMNFGSIEGLRAWLAWWVVFGHAVQFCGAPGWLHPSINRILHQGDVAVKVFIIISGFVITHLLLTKQERYTAYLIRRFFRIAPIYYFCLALAFLTTSFYQEAFVDLPFAEGRDIRNDRIIEQNVNGFWHFLAHLPMLHGALPDSILKFSTSTFLVPAWSLSLEWQFYLLAPPIIILMSRKLTSFSIMVGSLLLAGLLANHFLKDEYQYPAMLFLSIQYFLIGIISRQLIDKIKDINLSPYHLLFSVLIFVIWLRSLPLLVWSVFYIFCLYEANLFKEEKSQPPFKTIVYIIAGNPVLRWLGKVSYSTYLVHVPLFAVVVHFYARFLSISTSADMQMAIVVAILIVIFIPFAMYIFIEKPFIRLGAKFANQASVKIQQATDL